jgi:cytochrome P450
VAFNRIVKEPFTLSDGVQLPKGTHVAVASAPILMDPAVVPDPEKFDPFRSYRKRLEPGEGNRHLFAMTDKDHLHFGHGKYSCPGRFFAINEIKMIMCRLLLEYDFAYPENQGRPVNMTADENIYPDPAAKLLIKRRKNAGGNMPIPVV